LLVDARFFISNHARFLCAKCGFARCFLGMVHPAQALKILPLVCATSVQRDDVIRF
jgi:hypothetical protein